MRAVVVCLLVGLLFAPAGVVRADTDFCEWGWPCPDGVWQRPPLPGALKPVDSRRQQVEKTGFAQYVVATSKNRVRIRFLPTGGVLEYVWRKKRVRWSKWRVFAAVPHQLGFMQFSVPMKREKCYRVQVAAVNEAGESGKRQVEVCRTVL